MESISPVQLLQELVDIDSPVRNPEGVQRVQDRVAAELQKLGFSIQNKQNPVTHSANLLIAERKGKSDMFVTLVCHSDVVMGHAQAGKFRLRTDNVHAQGAGVIDDKGGIAIALKGLELYFRQANAKLSLRLVCSPNEESGSPGFIDDYRSLAKDTFLALAFEPALDNGNIIDSRRGNRWYQIHIQGKEAHAGRSKGAHVNAAHELAQKIVRLQKLNDAKADISLNVGHFSGGKDAFNIICGSADCKLDTRFSSFRDRDRMHLRIEQILNKSYVKSADRKTSSHASYSIADDCPPFSRTRNSKKYVELYLKAIAKREGRRVLAEMAGGAGDVNYMSDPKVCVLDGLGAIGGAMHTKDEFVYLPSLQSRSESLCDFLTGLGSVHK